MRLLSGLHNKPFSSRITKSWPRIRQQSHSSNPNPNPNHNPKDTNAQSSNTHGTPNLQQPQPPGTTVSTGGSPPARTLREFILNSRLGRLGRAYSRIQERRPYATQLCSTVVVYICGDLSAQLCFPSSPEAGYDPWRTARHLTVGAGASIPSYNWLMYLHHNFNFASKPLSIMTKVCLQQFIFAPVFNTYFFCMQSLLSGASIGDSLERLKRALPDSLLNSVKLWPIVQTINFMYVPPQFRSQFVGVVAVGWQAYLSWLNQKAAREVEIRDTISGSEAQSGTGVMAKA